MLSSTPDNKCLTLAASQTNAGKDQAVKLIIPLGEGVDQEFFLQKTVITIGRSPDNDVFIYDSRVSPDHALIRTDKGKFILYEMDSRQNTWVNDKLVEGPQALKAGDKIKMGRTTLFFLKDEDILDASQVIAIVQETNHRPPTDIVDENESKIQKQKAEEISRESAGSSLFAFLRHGRDRLGSRTLTQSDFLELVATRGVYEAFITGPAAILTMFQKVRGVEADDAFPQGTWQFYTEFGLREDQARHANETLGYHSHLPANAKEVDAASSWVYQIINTYFEYDVLLENEWTERTLLRLVDEVIEESIIEKVLEGKEEQRDTLEQFKNLTARLAEENLAEEERQAVRQKFKKLKEQIKKENVENVERESEEVKRNLGLESIRSDWVKRRPYKRDPNVPGETYPKYRRRELLAYFNQRVQNLPSFWVDRVWEEYSELLADDLPQYQEQMSIMYALKPERYTEKKEKIPLWKAKVGLISNGYYYLIDVCARDEEGNLLLFDPNKPDEPGLPIVLIEDEEGHLRDTSGARVTINLKGEIRIEDEHGLFILRPVPPQELKRRVTAILHHSWQMDPNTSELDLMLVEAPRAEQEHLRGLLSRRSQWELKQLRLTPIILNWDLQEFNQTLGDIRSNRRGISDHALTIFRTDQSFIFDQSHIFFDAIWGIALSQIMTDGAIELYETFAQLPTLPPTEMLEKSGPQKQHSAYQLYLKSTPSLEEEIKAKAYRGRRDVSVENCSVDLAKINELRRLLRPVGINISVNDILTLYRSIYDPIYSEMVATGLGVRRKLMSRLDGVLPSGPQKLRAVKLIDETLIEMKKELETSNPSLLIPMDASFVDPKERLFPTTFRNPFVEIYTLYRQTRGLYEDLLVEYSQDTNQVFIEKRKELCKHILGFTEYFGALKRMTMQGESFNTATIKMLAHLPPSMQSTLNLIPQKISVLNEIIKGEEVFSNVGRVARGSSLSRFMSAKDDGETKTLIWGIMSDKDGRLTISLRDFRKHVPVFIKIGGERLARMLAQDYLDRHARGLNNFVKEMIDIVNYAP